MSYHGYFEAMESMCGSCDGRGVLIEWVEITSLDDAQPQRSSYAVRCPDCGGTGSKRVSEETFSPWPILGWRNYKVQQGMDGFRLYGQFAAWENSWMEATCQVPGYRQRGRAGDEGVPAWDCACGIYMRKQPTNTWDILALCAAEEVIEHDLGYRVARCWVLAVAPTYGRLLRIHASTIKKDWPDVTVHPTAHPLVSLARHLTENPEEIPTWEERTANGHRQAPANHPPHEGTGPAAPQEGAF